MRTIMLFTISATPPRLGKRARVSNIQHEVALSFDRGYLPRVLLGSQPWRVFQQQACHQVCFSKFEQVLLTFH